WRYRRYRYQAWQKGKSPGELLTFEEYERLHVEPARRGGRPGRGGGPEQVQTRRVLVDQEGWRNTETTKLGKGPDGSDNFVDLERPNKNGGTDYAEVDDMLAGKRIPKAALRAKLKTEIPALGRNDTLTFIDKVDPSKRITYHPTDPPAVVDTRT